MILPPHLSDARASSRRLDLGHGGGRGQIERAVEGRIDGAPVVRAESHDRLVEARDVDHDVAFGVVVAPVVDLPAPAVELDDRDALGLVGHAVEAADHRPGRRVHVIDQGLVLDGRDEVRRAAVEAPEELRQVVEAVDVDDRIVVLDVVGVVAQQRRPVRVLHLEHAAPDLQPILAEAAQAAGLRIVDYRQEHDRASDQCRRGDDLSHLRPPQFDAASAISALHQPARMDIGYLEGSLSRSGARLVKKRLIPGRRGGCPAAVAGSDPRAGASKIQPKQYKFMDLAAR